MAQMFDHAIKVLRGFDPITALTKVFPIASGQENNALEGRVGHLDSNGQWVPGGTGTQVPIFLLPEPNRLVDGQPYFQMGLPETANYRYGLVGLAGFEIQTTEFDTSKTYVTNAILTANSDGTLTTPTTALNETMNVWVCGICSYAQIGEGTDIYRPQSLTKGTKVTADYLGKPVLTLWTYFLPQLTVASS